LLAAIYWILATYLFDRIFEMSTVTVICQDYSCLAVGGGGFLCIFIVVLGLLWYLLVYEKFVDMCNLVPFEIASLCCVYVYLTT